MMYSADGKPILMLTVLVLLQGIWQPVPQTETRSQAVSVSFISGLGKCTCSVNE